MRICFSFLILGFFLCGNTARAQKLTYGVFELTGDTSIYDITISPLSAVKWAKAIKAVQKTKLHHENVHISSTTIKLRKLGKKSKSYATFSTLKFKYITKIEGDVYVLLSKRSSRPLMPYVLVDCWKGTITDRSAIVPQFINKTSLLKAEVALEKGTMWGMGLDTGCTGTDYAIASTNLWLMGEIDGNTKSLNFYTQDWVPYAALFVADNELWLQVKKILNPEKGVKKMVSNTYRYIKISLPFDKVQAKKQKKDEKFPATAYRD